VTKLSACGDHESRTAGPAEIAAAALMESQAGDVVGERTYGDAAIRKR